MLNFSLPPIETKHLYDHLQNLRLYKLFFMQDMHFFRILHFLLQVRSVSVYMFFKDQILHTFIF